MIRAPRAAGFTLVEVMVALVLLAIVALGVTTTLISTQRALRENARWMQATQLAAQALERYRTGPGVDPAPAPGFLCTLRSAPWEGHPGVQRVEVSVSWDDGVHSVHLITLVRS